MSAVLAYLDEKDRRMKERVALWRLPRFLRWWLLSSSHLGDGWIWVGTGLLLLLGGAPYQRLLAAGALSCGLASLVVVVTKRRVRRCRPVARIHNTLFGQFGQPSPDFDRFSFPSGHATNAFAIATVLAAALPAAAPLLLVLAVSIATSRVLLGVHFLSDVVAGALLGVGVGTLVYQAVLA